MFSDKVNPWLAEKLRGLGHDPALRLLVEVEPGKAEEVIQQLRRMGVSIRGKPLLGIFIPVTVPSAAYIDAIARLPGVVKIHYDTPMWIKPVLPIPMPSMRDPLLGTIKVSKVEVPGTPLPLPPTPAAILPAASITQFHRPGYEILPTEMSRRVMVDVETTLLGRNVRAAILDTGAPYPFHPQVMGKIVHAIPNPYIPEDPFDHMGHGSWCSLEVAGLPFNTRFGRVSGVAWGAELWHIKVLSTAGFGSNSSVIWGMQKALEVGAKVVSMSLGGPAQGGVDDDPNCKAAKILHDHGILVVVAAGNDGPSDWTVDSPGFCPWVLTVASVSLTDDLQVAWFSSRGPSAKWYKTHQSQWQEDLAKYGELLLKPDVAAPGGGRHKEGTRPEEVLYQGSHGWFDGFYDFTKDMFEAMMGTSMATPTMAGTVALIAEAEPTITIDEVKRRLAATAEGEKSIETGWGIGKLSRLRK